jgi:hypothetical protein
MGLSFTIAAGPRQCSYSRARVMTIFYCLRFETHPAWKARSPYLYPSGTGWPGYTPRHWVPFSSPPATSTATGNTLRLRYKAQPVKSVQGNNRCSLFVGCCRTLSVARLYIGSHAGMGTEWWIGKDLEGSGRRLIGYYPDIHGEGVRETRPSFEPSTPWIRV